MMADRNREGSKRESRLDDRVDRVFLELLGADRMVGRSGTAFRPNADVYYSKSQEAILVKLELPGVDKIEGWVDDSGEGRWTVAEAIEQDVPAPVITLSLMMRLVSRQEDSFAARILAAQRNQFGGHSVRRRDSDGS